MRSRRSNRHHSPKTPTMVFAGQRLNGRIRVFVKGKPVDLTKRLFNLLVELFFARMDSEAGFLEVRPVQICRLRQAIDDAVGAGAGSSLIKHGAMREYRLTVPRDQLAEDVTCARSCCEICDNGIVCEKLASRLKQISMSSEIRLKSF